MGLLDKAKDKALHFKDETSGALADVAVAKLHEALARFNAALPLLREAGCAPTSVDVDVGLPPKILASFATKDVVDETIARITAENPDKPLACAILKALVQGAHLQRGMQVGRLQASTLSIEIGLVPVLKLGFTAA